MKILVVEDEIKLANVIKRALELQKYIVDVAYDGESGLDLAIGEEYDLIILDVMLPHIDGVEVCRQMRKRRKKYSSSYAYCKKVSRR
jgi:DNA-binding response OmpR family regulator